jgi:hypothetical protein
VSPLVFLLIAVVLIAAGTGVLYVRHRPPKSYDAGIRAFRREMNALAPPEESAEEVRRTRGRRR